MNITREQLVKDLRKKSGFYQNAIYKLFMSLDELVMEYYADIDENEELNIQITRGIKIGGKLVPQRERVNPKDLSPIVCGPTIKPFAKFSDWFREEVQKSYNKKHRKA